MKLQIPEITDESEDEDHNFGTSHYLVDFYSKP